MSIEQLQKACGGIEQDVYESLSPAGVTKQYVTEGAASPEQAERQVEYWKNQLKEQ